MKRTKRTLASQASSSKRPKARRNVPGILAAFLTVSVAGGVLGAGLFVPVVGATGTISNNTIDAFEALPSELTKLQTSATTRVLAADGSLITTFYDENRDPVKLDQISQYLQDAVVAVEDERFFEHSGVDLKGLARAAVVNEITGTEAQGASTLTQQLVKNTLTLAAHAEGDEEAKKDASRKSKSRKMKEIRLATALEKVKTKQEILEAYLNIAWFGGQVNGVEAAAKYYFGTSAAKITLPQAATLAGMIQSPEMYNIASEEKIDVARERRDSVLEKMLRQGKIDQATYDKAVGTKLKPKITPTLAGCVNSGLRGYFCDYVYNVITRGDDFTVLGETQAEREAALLRGGYTIKTTLDPKVLDAAWKSVKTRIPPKDDSRVATATVTVEPGTGKVLSITQNKYYKPSDARQNSMVNFSTDYQFGGSTGFQTGSTFKPVTLATWLEAGHSLNDKVEGSAGSLPESSFRYCGRNVASTAPYNFSNAADGAGKGKMTVADATKNSVNGAYIRMTQKLDLCDIQAMAKKLGMHRAQPVVDPCVPGNYSAKKPKTTSQVPQCQPSVTLGTVSQSPMTMAVAYATFASGGIRCDPVVVTSIEDRNGKKLKVPDGNCKRTLSAQIASTTTVGLSKVFTSGTAASVGPLTSGQKASGKTGTTNSSQDTWFVGYTPQLATAVWVGPETVNGRRRTMQNIRINGHTYGAVYGATFAARIWKDVMTSALKGKKLESF